MMKTAVVTGAGGFIGRALTQELVERGYKVYAIAVSEKEQAGIVPHENVHVVLGNLLCYEDIQKKINEKIDILYHLAWVGISAADYKDIDVQKENVILSINAVKLAIALKAEKFLFAGSNQEYLMDTNSVDGQTSSASVYGTCKLCCRKVCEVLCRNQMQFNATAFTNVFGVGDYSRRTANLFIGKLLNGDDLDLIKGEHLYDWIYIDDAVNGLIAVGEKGVNNKQYYIGNRTLVSFREIIEKIGQILAPQSKLNFGRYQDTSYTNYAEFDLESLYADTGFECKSDFKESILKTAEWLKSIENR